MGARFILTPVGLKKEEKQLFPPERFVRDWWSQGLVKVRKLGRTLEKKAKMESCHGDPRKDLIPG